MKLVITGKEVDSKSLKMIKEMAKNEDMEWIYTHRNPDVIENILNGRIKKMVEVQSEINGLLGIFGDDKDVPEEGVPPKFLVTFGDEFSRDKTRNGLKITLPKNGSVNVMFDSHTKFTHPHTMETKIIPTVAFLFTGDENTQET